MLLPGKKSDVVVETSCRTQNIFVSMYQFRDVLSDSHRNFALSDPKLTKILYVTDNTLENKVAEWD